MNDSKRNDPVRFRLWLPLIAGVVAALSVPTCLRMSPSVEHADLPVTAACDVSEDSDDPDAFLVTAYCNCKSCCSWRPRYWFFGEPVFASGPRKGQPKIVGQTACGRLASPGTVAADAKLFKFGTRLEIPGYGIGRVEDRGGAIKGRHIDIWFPTHDQARAWGSRHLRIRVLKDK